LLVPLLQSGPKSPPTCSRVGLAWVRLASSLALLQRRQAMRGGSRFNLGQPLVLPAFLQHFTQRSPIRGIRRGNPPFQFRLLVW